MKYVGMQTQIWRNNRNTAILLCMYPVIILAMVLSFILVLDYVGVFCSYIPDSLVSKDVTVGGVCAESRGYGIHWPVVWFAFLKALPWTIGVVAVWFLFAYLFNVSLIRHVTHARPLERKENVRVYNIVENLCIAGGIEMPQINIVEDPGLNAFASGIDINSFTITLTTGIIDTLDNDELSAVVAHELTHIKNRDTRLMVVCIVFVGLISILQTIFIEILKGSLRSAGRSSRRSKKNGGGGIILIALIALVGVVITSIAYFFSYINRLAISRSREYVADAGAAELCADPLPLARALQKVSRFPGLANVKRNDVAQLYIIHPDEEDNNGMLHGLVKKVDSIFWTHPDTPDRIKLLEQF
ncbi:heat shock protein HtpX [Fibrobacter sp. UWR4]|nr:heat shock protein HtpX [Fibrobacter sp. UWR4]PZW65420.1 heat shock protein HtpX [Fibrobacter sp. UWR1]